MIFSKSCKSTWKPLNSILIIKINFKYILFWTIQKHIFKQIHNKQSLALPTGRRKKNQKETIQSLWPEIKL